MYLHSIIIVYYLLLSERGRRVTVLLLLLFVPSSSIQGVHPLSDSETDGISGRKNLRMYIQEGPVKLIHVTVSVMSCDKSCDSYTCTCTCNLLFSLL